MEMCCPQDTGALKGLYGASEMKSDHAKDRDAKMKYIEKAVFCVSFAVGETLSVKPGKVVAGQEPEKTNEFLQMLARIVKEKIDTKEHVKRVLNGMVEKCEYREAQNYVSECCHKCSVCSNLPCHSFEQLCTVDGR